MTDSKRTADLREMLSMRRREVQDDVTSRLRHGRGDQTDAGRDEIDVSDADTQGDIELALLQMRADALSRIDVALFRLDAGEYGSCVDCHGDIAERRLRALPFAVRCQTCEEKREQAHQQMRRRDDRRDNRLLFPDMVSS